MDLSRVLCEYRQYTPNPSPIREDQATLGVGPTSTSLLDLVSFGQDRFPSTPTLFCKKKEVHGALLQKSEMNSADVVSNLICILSNQFWWVADELRHLAHAILAYF